ncbi:HNH endonuclease signature motif containing protein [Leucobacter sp. wl10]|uniref:HNH endonuclease signature motif containing protein n=1 Tax=Leucobacter sp. wl10 TaxID=2304677 RepID=UPI000E5B2FC0|nr:HNH endonuclease signature motif containing protein [Leucobacter sp. wl10]RGE20084.1 HNH endonuclease [Leucobacter sp. wl10]
MEFFSDISARIAALRDLTGEISDAGLLPIVVNRLDDAAALELLELASEVGQMAERLRVAAVGAVARRSSRASGHAGLAQSRGHRNAVALVQRVTGVSRSEAAKQVRIGESLYDVPGDPSGLESTDESAEQAPWHAPLGRALLEGVISTAQHDAILRGLGEPPQRDGERATSDDHAAWALAAEQLIAEASERTVEELAKAARFLRDRLDPVGAEERFLARYEARSFRMWTDREGRACGSLVFDDLSATWVRSVLNAALRPRRGGPRFVDPAERARAEELAADPRTNEQLAFDLLLDVLRAGSLADAESVYGARQPGVRLVQVVDAPLSGDDRHEAESAGAAYAEDEVEALPAWVARQQACTVGTIPVTVDRGGNPLNLGRTTRLFTPAQRLALAIRDGGCRWRACDRPASYCEAHHIDPWSSGHGRTDIDRGVLLCRFHHMQLHHGGWRITRDGTDDFVLHDPGGGQVPLPTRVELRYAWAGIDPPPRRFTLAA